MGTEGIVEVVEEKGIIEDERLNSEQFRLNLRQNFM